MDRNHSQLQSYLFCFFCVWWGVGLVVSDLIGCLFGIFHDSNTQAGFSESLGMQHRSLECLLRAVVTTDNCRRTCFYQIRYGVCETCATFLKDQGGSRCVMCVGNVKCVPQAATSKHDELQPPASKIRASTAFQTASPVQMAVGAI